MPAAGAIALILSTAILLDGKIGNMDYRSRQFFLVAMVVVFTTFVQGGTTSFLLQKLGLSKRPAEQQAFLKAVLYKLGQNSNKHIAYVKGISTDSVLGTGNMDRIAELTELRPHDMWSKYSPMSAIEKAVEWVAPTTASQSAAVARHTASLTNGAASPDELCQSVSHDDGFRDGVSRRHLLVCLLCCTALGLWPHFA